MSITILTDEGCARIKDETLHKIIAAAAITRGNMPQGEAAVDLWHILNKTHNPKFARSPLDVKVVKPFRRTLTLYDEPGTREKVTVMEKFDVMTDDERNPDFEGIDEFLEWGSSYRITIEKV